MDEMPVITVPTLEEMEQTIAELNSRVHFEGDEDPESDE